VRFLRLLLLVESLVQLFVEGLFLTEHTKDCNGADR
jgi:hypothetical protein